MLRRLLLNRLLSSAHLTALLCEHRFFSCLRPLAEPRGANLRSKEQQQKQTADCFVVFFNLKKAKKKDNKLRTKNKKNNKPKKKDKLSCASLLLCECLSPVTSQARPYKLQPGPSGSNHQPPASFEKGEKQFFPSDNMSPELEENSQGEYGAA